jgi:hypothetical protein
MCDVGCDKFAQRTPAHQGLGAGRRCLLVLETNTFLTEAQR